MSETDLSTVVILISTCAGLLLLIAVGVFLAGSRLARIERLLAGQKGGSRAESAAPERGEPIESRPGGPFDQFLDEDPSRKLLTKKEQAAAYRKWRQQNGMNWSNS